ncbi:NAD(P)/FAD-dependent oxidoreductase [Marinicauda algicola]|nr:FAD-dependent oxidoreductase [Marinicauda algicola]
MPRPVPGRVAVIGAGASGLACAFALLRRKVEVVVFESGRAGGGALAASGGMLAAGFETAFEARDPERFASLALHAAELWPGWAADIEAASGRELGYRRRGSITPAFTRAELAHLDAAQAHAAAQGIVLRRLDARGAAAAEPGLAPCLGALEFPGDGGVDNRALGPALAEAIVRLGGTVREDCAVERVAAGSDGVTLGLAEGAPVRFDAVIVATGSMLPAGLEPLRPLLRPVKGQMIAFDLEGVAPPIRIVRALSVYLAAKPGGRLVAGATSEPGVDTLSTEPAVVERLAALARAVFPGLAGRPVAERWAGIRPAMPDGLPILGPGPLPGVHLALGGYRNGVLLAPAMGEALAGSILSGRLPETVSVFGVQRFGLDG